MALRVWLPLRGNLNNQGLDQISLTSNSGATIDTNGKIGSCYNFDGADDWIRFNINKHKYDNKPLTLCCWFKCDQSKSSGCIIDIAADLCLEYTYSSNLIYFKYWRVYGTSSRIGDIQQTSIGYDATLWHHIAIVYDKTVNQIYVDGILSQQWNSKSQNYWISMLADSYNQLAIGRSSGSTSWIGGKVNDVRIYDHALSAKEVEEISKGLILHYKFDDSYAESSLFLTSEITNTAYNSPISKYGYNKTSNLGKVNGYFQGKYCTKVYTLTDDQTSQPYAYFSNLFTSDGTNSPTYKTLSFDYYTTVPTTTWLNIYKLGSGSGTATWKTTNSQGVKSGVYTNSSNSILVQPGEWNHVEVTFQGTTPEDAQWGYCINGPRYTSNSNYYFLYANIQLELNDHATGYGERMHSNIIYDSSGYQNNGIIFNPLKIKTDTLRYNVSTLFDGETSAIKVPYTDIASTDDIFTLNLWFKKDDLGSKNYETLFGGPSGFEMDTRAGSATALTLYMASTRGTIFTQFNFGEWYMITMVNNGTNELYYVNAELKKTIDKKPMPAGNYYIGAWSTETRQNYKGLISDFRIYKTALTDKQVKELYDTSVTVDKDGNIYAREVIE